MDGNPEFRRFFLKAMEGARAVDENPPANPPRRRTEVLPNLDAVLDRIIGDGGTQLLPLSAIQILRDRSTASTPDPVIVRRLKTLISDHGLPERPVLQWAGDTRNPSLLVPFFLVVIHRALLRGIEVQREALLKKYKEVVGLRVLILRHSLRSAAPENVRLTHLREELRQGQQHLKAVISLVLSRAAPFEITYQFFINNSITKFLEFHFGCQQDRITAKVLANPPTAEEVRLHQQLVGLPREREQLVAEIREYENDRAQLREQLVRTRNGDRDRLREALATAGEQLSIRRERRNLIPRRQSQLRRQLGNRIEIVELYRTRRGQFRYTNDERSQRDRFLEEFNSLIAAHTSLRLEGRSEQERWELHGQLLDRLTGGDGNVSLEFIMAAFLHHYGTLNRNRDIGLGTSSAAARYSGGTYTGHGNNPIDLGAAPGEIVRPVAPPLLFLPRRFVGIPGSYTVEGPFSLRRTAIREEDVRISSDCEQVIFKIGSGLGFTMDELTETMDAEGDTNLAPELIESRPLRAFDPIHVLIGLAFHQLTEDQNAIDFNQSRNEILGEIEGFVRHRLGIPEAEEVLRPPDRATRPPSDIGVFIPRRRREILRAVQDMLHEQSARTNPDGVVHRLWRLLWALRRRCGLPRFRAGGTSVTIQHHYFARGQDVLIVKVHYSHLRGVNARLAVGQELPVGDVSSGTLRLGNVGLTGNARSSHLHMQIQLFKRTDRSEIPFGAVLPHEFFPPRHIPQ